MKLCIIGAGFTGTAALCEILKTLTETQSNEIKAALKKDLEITVIEQGARFGCGYAYNPDIWSACHRLNHDAGSQQPPQFTAEDSIQDWQFRDFYNWLKENGRRILEEHPAYAQELDIVDLNTWQPSLTEYYPRGLFGLYLEDVFEKTVSELENKGITILCFNNTKVIGYTYNTNEQTQTLPAVDLLCENSLTQRPLGSDAFKSINETLICSGHWRPTPPMHPHILSGIPLQKQQQILKTAKNDNPFFVKGTGLTGIDYILQIADTFGDFQRDSSSGRLVYNSHNDTPPLIIAASRKGLLPNVRPQWQPIKDFTHWTKENLESILDKNQYFRLSGIIPLVEAEILAQTGNPVDWLELLGLKAANAYTCLQSELSQAQQASPIFCTLSVMAYGDLRAHTNPDLAEFFMQHGGVFERLHPEDKKFFNEQFLSHFLRYLAPMSPINGEKLKALFEKNCLEVEKLGADSCYVSTQESSTLSVTLPSRTEGINVAYYYDATNQERDVSDHPSPFIQQLLQEGYGSRTYSVQNTNNSSQQYKRSGFGVNPHTMHIGLQEDRNIAISPFRMVGALVDSWLQDRNFATGSVDLMPRVIQDILTGNSRNIYLKNSQDPTSLLLLQRCIPQRA